VPVGVLGVPVQLASAAMESSANAQITVLTLRPAVFDIPAMAIPSAANIQIHVGG
jgi:hypothetical protein